jgi:hypothetical protein
MNSVEETLYYMEKNTYLKETAIGEHSEKKRDYEDTRTVE